MEERSRVACLRGKRVAEVMTMDVRNELLSQPVVDGVFTSDPFLPKDPKVGLPIAGTSTSSCYRFWFVRVDTMMR